MECKPPANGTLPNRFLGFLSYQYVILFVAVLSQVAVSTTTQGVPVLASFYRVDLHLSSAEVGLFTGALAGGAVLIAVAAGWATDRFGVRPVLLLGPLAVGGAILVLSVAPSFGLAVVFAFAAGAGHGLGNPAIAKAILYWFPLTRRATAMGIKQTGVPLAGMLAASTLPALAVAFHWRYAMTALGLTAVATGLVSFLLYRDSASTMPQKAKRPPTPGAIKGILKNKNTWLICGLASALVGGQNCVITYMILYLKDTLQLPPTDAGWYLAIAHMGGLAARVSLGIVSDFWLGGRRKVVLVGCGFVAASMLSLTAIISPGVSTVLLVSLMIGLGMSTIGWNGIWVTMMAESSTVERAGTALGFGSVFIAVGSTIVPPVFGWIVDQTGSYSFAWSALAAANLLGSLVLAYFGKERAASPD